MAKHETRDLVDEEVFALSGDDSAQGEEAEFEDDDQLDDPEFTITFRPDPGLRRAVARRVLN